MLPTFDHEEVGEAQREKSSGGQAKRGQWARGADPCHEKTSCRKQKSGDWLLPCSAAKAPQRKTGEIDSDPARDHKPILKYNRPDPRARSEKINAQNHQQKNSHAIGMPTAKGVSRTLRSSCR